MGAFVAKQPNGLYCRFSSVVGTITDYNMTEKDYKNYVKLGTARNLEKKKQRMF